MPIHSWESLARGGLPFDPDLGRERADKERSVLRR